MSEKKWYQLKTEEVAALQSVSIDKGLTWKQAKERYLKMGANVLTEGKKVSLLTLLLNQFRDFMVLVLLVATLISGLLGEYTDAITIVAIVILNAILGFIQEFRAERSLSALKQLSAPNAQVLRDGEINSIPASEVVQGDIVFIESGDRVPADVRLFQVRGLYVEESALTGESLPVSKREDHLKQMDVSLGDRRNMAYMGTLVTRGSSYGIVVGTGMETEMGKIADLLDNTVSAETPLQRRLEQLGKILIAVAIVLTIVVVAAGIWHGHEPYAMFLAGVSLAVAAIPEGLPAIVTIALAMGVQRMIKRRAIVRKLPSVETLGCASVICSDKTGTLTQNKMTVTHLWVGGDTLQVSGSGYEPEGEITHKGQGLDVKRESGIRRLLEVGVLCNNSAIYTEEEGKKKLLRKADVVWKLKGDPTEGALIVAGAKAGLLKDNLSTLWRRTNEFPFDSERKLMSVVVEQAGTQYVMAKGAPDVLLNRCNQIYYEGKVIPLTAQVKQKVLQANEQMASQALRNLAMAYKEVPSGESIGSEQAAERRLVFAGLTGMIDPPRDEVKEAILKCKHAGIKTVMITGDHQTTAEAIARQLGMIPAEGLVVNGSELQQMSEQELAEKVEQIYVYARVSPEHKLKIVKAMQANGHVVAMTGDGVNDAPAIKAADIGIAMGITGTDVSKEASALVLSDDNFATIVAAIEEGRGIYDNIRKFIRYLLASNVGEILTMFFAMMMGLPLPLVPIMILWVNLVTDGLPAMALGVDPSEGELMKQKPRNSRENIFARGLGWKIISRGVLIGLCTLGTFWLTLQQDPDNLMRAQTVAFATLVMAQLIHVFDCRSDKSIFHRNIFENKWLVWAVLSSIVLLIGVLYIDALQPIFKTVDLGLNDWILVLIGAGIPTFIVGIGSILTTAVVSRKGGYAR
jgi:Ca2+-transporting ATPase